MTKKKINISDALFSKVRQRVLGLLYTQPDSDFHTNEIIRLTDSGTGAVQRELESLTGAGLVIVKQVGNQKRYQANRDTPFFTELRSIILKTFGLTDVLRETLKPIAKQIHIAFIYGSIAKQEDTAKSDIDLMIIGENLTYADVFQLLEKAESQLGRKINPTFYSPSEWLRKNKDRNDFVKKILKHTKIFLIGTEDELAKLKIGDEIEGEITEVTDFGAFVRLSESLDALIHSSEIDWKFVDNPKDVLHSGEKIKAKIINLDQNGRIFLSLKALKEDPWPKADELYQVGIKVKGKVIKIRQNGAFVELPGDIIGMLPASELGGKTPAEALEAGKEYDMAVISIDTKDHKLALTLEKAPE